MATIKKFFSYLYRGWMAFATALGFVQTRIILFVIYTTAVGSVSIVSRLFGQDLLRTKPESDQSFWLTKAPLDETPEGLLRQF